jgi:hypothetical protein
VPADRERSRFYSTRPRRVPPEFCTDELLESCSVTAALLLYRIVSQADDQGRLPGSTKSIRANCFAMRPELTESKVASAICELVGAGFLIRYEIDGRAFLQVDHWSDLQGRWGRRAYPSRYPAPPGWTGDWISVKPEEAASTDDSCASAAPEVRATSTQDARQVHTPVPVPSSFSSSITPSGLSSSSQVMRDWESVGQLVHAAANEQGPRGGARDRTRRRYER